MKRAILHHEAEEELLDAVHYYELREPGAGIRLNEAVRRAFDKIKKTPGIGARYRNTTSRF